MSPDSVEARRKAGRERRVTEALANFKTLPDDAILRVYPTARICACGPATIWRNARLGTFPAPIKLSPKITGWRVGDLRRYLANPEAWSRQS